MFRAEKHNTKRHLNEYTSLDFEMGYIDSFDGYYGNGDRIPSVHGGPAEEANMPQDLEILNVELPDVSRIPAVRFDEAKRLVSEKYDRTDQQPL